VQCLAAVGHANHGSLISEERVFLLEDQIEHKRRFMKQLTLRHGEDTRFILMGHSIGAYMCLKLLALNEFDVLQCFMLFPTFRHLYAGFNWFVKLAVRPVMRNVLANIVHYASPITPHVLKLTRDLSDEAKARSLLRAWRSLFVSTSCKALHRTGSFTTRLEWLRKKAS
jgi:hypothetical protein